MPPLTARILVAASLVLFAGVLGALIFWPDSEPRADLVTSAPTASSTTTTTTLPPTTLPTTTTTAVPVLDPSRMQIPAIGVDAPVVPVGLNPDGSMEIPGATEVGWYELGVPPGTPRGSTVLAAHVDYAGQKGAFFDLRSLGEGEEIVVVGSDGEELRYTVSARFQVDKNELPVEELFRTSGPETLTLITCGGAFDRSVRSYRDNIVVQAVPVHGAVQ